MENNIHIGLHPHWQLWGATFNADTLISMWIVSVVLVILAIIINRFLNKISSPRLTLFQSAVELLIENLKSLPESRMGEKGLKYFPLIGTLFIFILFCNWFEILPFSLLHLAPPTSDINVTAGLAIFTVAAAQYYGMREKGWNYFKRFVQPFFIFLPLNILEELAKPFSLAIRLFGNIFAKETIIVILISLLAFPLLYPIPILVLSMLIGTIQAFIFMLLATFYIEIAVSEEH